jgi:hypothetical protein
MADDQSSSDPWATWRGRIQAATSRRDDRVGEWQNNVTARKGGLRGADATVDRVSTDTSARVSVPRDWSLTKAKIAQLYSQTPEVRLTPRYPEFQQAVPAFGRELNSTITDINIGATIEEILADIVNAAGIGAVIVSCEKRTEPKEVPLVDPATLPPDMQGAVLSGAMPTMTVEQTLDIQYHGDRISPPDLLIPADFTGSDYDKARWLGHDGRVTWAQSTVSTNAGGFGLTEEQKDHVLGSDKQRGMNTLNTETATFKADDVVTYHELFYWRHYYHPEETSFKALQRLVFVDGVDAPVINEPYRAQKRDEQSGRMLGVTKNPIRVCTLTYISDESLPPSDSSMGRFQVSELEASRDAMVQQRKHSVPIRWFQPTLLSPNGRTKIENGETQDFIPVMGSGDRAIGEVARASFPQEKFEFEKVISNDLTEIWQVGTNQAGAFASGERSAREAGIIERNFQRRVGQEQDKVSKFFLGIAEVLAGHLALYGTFDLPDEVGIAREALATGFTYSVRVDSTVRLDAEQRIAQLDEFVNKWGQSGYINLKPIAEERAELSGLDPSKVVIDPQPKPPEPVKVSIGSAEDIINPVMLAALMRTGQAPGPQDLAAAIQLLTAAMAGAIPMVPPTPPDNRPPGETEKPGISNPDWSTQPRVDKRDEDGGA